ncbi:MAG: SGNH/GDSL hydrolase family protein [Spirochaetes bacterium]|nr:SGNH/GDSL hydrolase family protein [Spirochaetota bacterium]
MLKRTLLILGCIAVVLGALYGYGRYMATRLPENRPALVCGKNFNPGNKKVVVCIGDSITHGAVSENYVDMTAAMLDSSRYIVLNAGINSELAYNALVRLDEVIRCNPDYVTILIGTNDANASLSEENSARYTRDMKLPRRPDKSWFRDNLVQICRRLKKETRARIALLSLPPIGEKLESREMRRSLDYSAVINDVAAAEKTDYLPLGETMIDYLSKHNPAPKHPFSDIDGVMYTGIFKHYILRKSYDTVSRENGFLLVTDFLHLNGTGAKMAADLIAGFVKGGE